MPDGAFIHFDLDTLTTLKEQWLACLAAIATAHQSYSIAGRTFTRADLEQVRKTVAEIGFAIALKNGTARRISYGDMSC